ncbi:MAG: hypothetical protein M1131_05885 [Actinobacteria bacterium]|jgi:hypothetical protein|nr:hypothetical protein [Actinomycetota bacterium]MCL6094341.1 hypothetical protein [Actinomycetota bacterium]
MKLAKEVAFLELASLIGSCYWLETRLFESCGVLAQVVNSPALCAHLDAQSRQHAWHAMLWEEQIPTIAGKAQHDFVRAPNQAVEHVFQLLEHQRPVNKEVSGTGERTGEQGPNATEENGDQAIPSSPRSLSAHEIAMGMYRVVVPRLITSYNILYKHTSDITAASTKRVLRLILSDELAGWQEGEMLVEQLLCQETGETGMTLARLQELLEVPLTGIIGLL